MTEHLLECRSLSFSYDEEKVFEDLSLSIMPGEAVLLMGPSGCGKSSLAYCLAGLYPQYAGKLSGEIYIDGQRLDTLGPQARAKKLSILFQNPDDQFCMEQGLHELFFALENINYSGDIMSRAQELLHFAGLEDIGSAPIYTLSGGTKQKLALATALATEAKLLILDEPFANIDPAACIELSNKLGELKRRGLSLFIIDHRPEHWLDIADRIMLMDDKGQIFAEDMQSSELTKFRDEFTKRGLFADDRWLDEHTPLPAPKSAPCMVQGQNISLYYGKKCIAEKLDFQFQKGCITAIIGKNGSGKTSLLSAIAGVGKYRGSLSVEGEAGLVFQNPRFQFIKLSVEDEIISTLKAADPKGDEAELKEKAYKLLEEFSLYSLRESSPYALSQGQQRRLALLAMLAGNRPLLLLDEPTYAQDERSTRMILELLEERVKKGLTAVFATHDLSLAAACASRIYLMEDGKLSLLDREEFELYRDERRHGNAQA